MNEHLFLVIALLLCISFHADAEAVKKPRMGGKPPKYKEGEILVKYKTHVPESIRTANNARHGFNKIEQFKKIGVDHLKLPHGMSIEEAIRIYRANPDVEYAEPNYILHVEAIPDDTRFPEQWGLHNTGQLIGSLSGEPDADIDAPEAWDTTIGSEDVIIAVLDTGIDYDHPDLAENIWNNPDEVCGDSIDNDGNGYIDDCIGWDFINNDKEPMDDEIDSHGTHVSGTVAAKGNNSRGVAGVSWTARLMPLKILAADGTGPISASVEAILYAKTKGAHIINCSWGGSQPVPGSLTLKSAIDSVPGILFVCAAGNDADDTDKPDPCPSDSLALCNHYPSSFDSPNIISVAASNHLDSLSSFSNFGQTTVDLAAPGFFILSTLQANRTTSFADDFEPYGGLIGNSSWVTDGTWELTNAASSSFAFSLSDSVGRNYPPNANAIINSPGFALGTDCSLQYRLMLETEPDADFLFVEASTNADNGPWTTLSSHSGSTGGEFKTFVDSLSAFTGANPAFIRFRLTSDAVNEFDGAYIDDVKALCPFLDPEYGFLSGTSMAAPHVSGAAALLKSDDPSLTSLEMKALILNSVDVNLSFINKTLTGGRLNANNEFSVPAPPTAPSNLVASLTSNSSVELSWNDNSSNESSFIAERKTGGGTYSVIASLGQDSVTYTDSGLSPETIYVYRVKAFNGRSSAYSNEASAMTSFLFKSNDDDDRCFIATAAYGSFLAPEVSTLREFRDDYLLTTAPGRALVSFYYKHSPGIARIISKHGALRFMTRTALAPIVYGIRYPSATIVIVVLGLSVTLYWIRMRRKENHVHKK